MLTHTKSPVLGLFLTLSLALCLCAVPARAEPPACRAIGDLDPFPSYDALISSLQQADNWYENTASYVFSEQQENRHFPKKLSLEAKQFHLPCPLYNTYVTMFVEPKASFTTSRILSRIYEMRSFVNR